MSTIKILLDESRGIYIPKKFLENFDVTVWGLNENDLKDLQDPENAHYWETWDTVLNTAKHTDKEGHVWTLYQDGDLFAVREDHVWEGEQND